MFVGTADGYGDIMVDDDLKIPQDTVIWTIMHVRKKVER